MHDWSSCDILHAEQMRCQKVSLALLNTEQLFRFQTARYFACLSLERLDACPDVVELISADKRPHANAGLGRIADHDILQPFPKGIAKGLQFCRWHEHAANRRTFLSGFLSHICYDLVEHHLPCLAAGLDIGTHHRCVEAVSLDIDAHGLFGMRVKTAQHRGGVSRARESKHVLRTQMLEQVTNRSGDERERALGEHSRVDDDLSHAVCQQRRTGCRFADNRHSRKPRDRRFLDHPPGRKIESVYMHSGTVQRRKDMFPRVSGSPADLCGLAVIDQVPVAELFADIDICQQGRSRAIDIELGVVSRVTAILDRQLDELLPVREEHLIERLQLFRPLGESHRAQRRSADGSGMRERRLKIDTPGTGLGQRFLGRGVEQGDRLATPLLPPATDKAF